MTEQSEQYAKVSTQSFRGGMFVIVLAAILGLTSVSTSYNFEFTAILAGIIALAMFQTANYAVTVATSEEQ